MGKFNVNASKRFDDSPDIISTSEQTELTSSPSSSNGRTFSYGNIEKKLYFSRDDCTDESHLSLLSLSYT